MGTVALVPVPTVSALAPFPPPLGEPAMRISRIRLSTGFTEGMYGPARTEGSPRWEPGTFRLALSPAKHMSKAGST